MKKALLMTALVLGLGVNASQAEAHGKHHHNSDYRKFKKVVGILDHIFDEPHHGHYKHHKYRRPYRKVCHFGRYGYRCSYHKHYVHRYKKHYKHYAKKRYCKRHHIYHYHH